MATPSTYPGSTHQHLEVQQSTTHQSGTHQGSSHQGSTHRSGTQQRLQLVFVTTEVAPFSKVGGLADVCKALPTALAAR